MFDARNVSCSRLGHHLLAFVLAGVLSAAMDGLVQPVRAADLDTAKNAFYAKITSLRWIAYAPSTFDPRSREPLLRSDIEADFRALKAAGFDGVVTYSCVPTGVNRPGDTAADEINAVGMDQLPEIAKQIGFQGFVLGVWNPKDKQELAAAARLGKAKLVDAICVGNEGLDVRYDWEVLRDAMRTLRESTGVPITTTEQIDDYGRSELCDPREVDWLFPNIHPVFQNVTDPRKAAQWTVFMAGELETLLDDRPPQARLPVLIKETGWPSQGMGYHNETSQKVFWESLDQLASASNIPYVTFEAFDQPWKHEDLLGRDIGPHWGVFSSVRDPKPAVHPKGSATAATAETGN